MEWPPARAPCSGVARAGAVRRQPAAAAPAPPRRRRARAARPEAARGWGSCEPAASSAAAACALALGCRRAGRCGAAAAALGGESDGDTAAPADLGEAARRGAPRGPAPAGAGPRAPGGRRRSRRARLAAAAVSAELWSIFGDSQQAVQERQIAILTLERVVLPTILAAVGATLLYAPFCRVLQDTLDLGNTGTGPVLTMLGMDQSQFMQNFLTVNGLLFTILCGNTYTALYSQNERIYNALFMEVSEAKSLLEQACLVCQSRPFYPRVLSSIGEYVENDLRRLDAEPSELLAKRPMEDPLEYILYATSVGVPSIIYDTVRDLRQARAVRLGAMQRKLPAVHFLLLYALGLLELLAFPFLGAGNVSMAPVTNLTDGEPSILFVQGIFFGAMSGAIVMTLQIIYELWRPYGGAYTVNSVLETMVRGLEEELCARRSVTLPLADRATPWSPRPYEGAEAGAQRAPATGAAAARVV